jgi:protein SCO1/2
MTWSKFCAGAVMGLALFIGTMPAAKSTPREARNAKSISTHTLPRQAKHSSKFSNIWLTTQHGKRVRFYDDLVKDKVVLINLMFTTCTNICPLNIVQLTKLHDLLKRRMGRDITMLSITIDPEVDTPETLNQYWQAFGAKPGWLFLTGKYAEIEILRRELGVYDLDPIIDADKSQHSGILTIGNDRTDRWLALPIMMHLRQLGVTILRNTQDKDRHVR